MFIAEVYAAIATRFKEFQSKNKAAKAAGAGGVKDKEMGLGSMRALITALPQYHEILQRMTLHIQVGAGQKDHMRPGDPFYASGPSRCPGTTCLLQVIAN